MCEELIKGGYERRKPEIEAKLEEFHWRGLESSDEELFVELCHRICSSKTNFNYVKNALTELRQAGLLFSGDIGEIAKCLKKHAVRFHNKKAQQIVEARSEFLGEDPKISLKLIIEVLRGKDSLERRQLLRKGMKGFGLGWKQASEFLRNLGLGSDYAILDSRILGWLKRCGKIKEIPKGLTKRKYLEIEGIVRGWAEDMGIPLDELDLLLWSLNKAQFSKPL